MHTCMSCLWLPGAIVSKATKAQYSTFVPVQQSDVLGGCLVDPR